MAPPAPSLLPQQRRPGLPAPAHTLSSLPQCKSPPSPPSAGVWTELGTRSTSLTGLTLNLRSGPQEALGNHHTHPWSILSPTPPDTFFLSRSHPRSQLVAWLPIFPEKGDRSAKTCHGLPLSCLPTHLPHCPPLPTVDAPVLLCQADHPPGHRVCSLWPNKVTPPATVPSASLILILLSSRSYPAAFKLAIISATLHKPSFDPPSPPSTTHLGQHSSKIGL